MNMRSSTVVAAVLSALSAGAFAQASAAPAAQFAAAPASSMTAGEVRKVDKEAGKITIRHEALENLGMPAMTMIFRVADPKFLDQIKEGEKVSFVADKVNGQFTVTKIEPAK
jgi:Cu(I)/Ag(I) efflux system protein CusF